MSRLDRRHLNLQTAHGTGLQLPRAHRIDGQLAAGDDPRGQLAQGDGVSFQRVRDSAQRDGGVSARQAVVGVEPMLENWLWLVPMILANWAMVVAASSALKSSQELPRSIMTRVKSDRCSVATPS